MHTRSNALTGIDAKPSALSRSVATSTDPPPVRFKPGDRAYIFQIKAFRRPFIEGCAIIVAPVPDVIGIYYVLFDNETAVRRRSVLPGIFQSAPEHTLEVLLTAWRASVLMEDLAPMLAGDTLANDNGED